MRAYLNTILLFIGSTTLTDIEWDEITITDQSDDLGVYAVLQDILNARESVSGLLDRLSYYFLAKGVDVSTEVEATTEIFVGGDLS
jgi:hypothetical protein